MGNQERFYVEYRPTDGAHATAWLVKDRQRPWWSRISQHRTEKAAQDRAKKMNARGGMDDIILDDRSKEA